MPWLEKLFRTYENCAENIEPVGTRLWPLAHVVKRAHVEVALDATGKLRRVRKLGRDEAQTVIPATEASAGRTSGPAPHPLSDELGYCAADFPGLDRARHDLYMKQLSEWCDSAFGHPKAKAVRTYLAGGSIWSDLSREGLFPVELEDSQGKKTRLADEKVFVRWIVELPEDANTHAWEDRGLIESWVLFDAAKNPDIDLCMVTGLKARPAQSHPRFVRRSRDGAKLISANDSDGYTFRGRFTDGKKDFGRQACTVSFDVTQKAHNALRWLIGRQSYRDPGSGQVFIAWSIAGSRIPDPFMDTLSLILGDQNGTESSGAHSQALVSDAGQEFALRLRGAIAGFRAKLQPTEDIVVMGMESAAADKGRLAITFYRELKGSEFLDRLENWHKQYAWPQNFGKDARFVGAPAPRTIAEVAYGARLDDKLRKATVERLLPCIIDGQPMPLSLVTAASRRAASRAGLDPWEWEKCLGVACGLFRGYSKSEGKEYQMALEEQRTTRDYLYGRLLALADNIEGYALRLADENRDTTAARLMQRFADRPSSTWRNIELALVPYKSRLRASEKGAAFLWKRERLLDEIQSLFSSDDFTSDRPLTAEFLLGFHCQRATLLKKAEPDDATDKTVNE
ncbi:MAG: type I-C CRISPR-associated protein Cas8c/Csd1 [Acidobacteria bacterium]|nr:type I-C CRISPR-associated protein Cas8c/Csd1 [Acidobacteriota bacterium]